MRERYRSLVEQSPDGIFVSQDSRIVLLNPAAVRLCGASAPEQILGRPLLDVVHPESRARLHECIARWMGRQLTTPVEAKMARLDGAVVDVEVTGAGLEDGD